MIECFDGWTHLFQVIWANFVQMILRITA